MSGNYEENLVRSVGGRIRSIRCAQKLNLNEIARMTGISASAMSLIETGKRDPRLTTLGRIAVAYRVSLADLLDETPHVIPREEGEGGQTSVQGYDLGDYL